MMEALEFRRTLDRLEASEALAESLRGEVAALEVVAAERRRRANTAELEVGRLALDAGSLTVRLQEMRDERDEARKQLRDVQNHILAKYFDEHAGAENRQRDEVYTGVDAMRIALALIGGHGNKGSCTCESDADCAQLCGELARSTLAALTKIEAGGASCSHGLGFDPRTDRCPLCGERPGTAASTSTGSLGP